MPALSFRVEDNLPQVEASFDKFLANLRPAVVLAFDRIAFDMIDHAQSYTGDLQPPVFVGNPPRPAHPGAWADITTELMQGYQYSARWKWKNQFHFVFGNTAPHAAWVEAKTGYWVVRGLYEGFFQRKLREHLSRTLGNVRG